MKVLHLIDSGGLYGAEQVVLDLVRQQRLDGIEATLVAIVKPGEEPRAIEKEAQRRRIPSARLELHAGLRPSSVRRFAAFAGSAAADVFHCHGYKAISLAGCVARSGRRGFFVATLHGWTGQGRLLSKNAWYERLERLLLTRMDAVVAVAESLTRDRAVRRLRRLHVVSNGIPETPDTCEQLPPIPPEILDFCRRASTVIAVGRLADEKRHADIIEAISHLRRKDREVQLLLVGEGGMRDHLEAKVSRLGLDSAVRIPGYVRSAWRLYPEVRAMVVSSETEALPICVLEAMRAGLPVVSTAVGDVPAVLDDGRAGVIVRVGDVSGLAGAIMALLDNSGEASSISTVAQARWQAMYTTSAMSSGYAKVYRKLMGQSETKAG